MLPSGFIGATRTIIGLRKLLQELDLTQIWEKLGKGKFWLIAGQESFTSPETLAYGDKLQLAGTLRSQECAAIERDCEESSWKGPWRSVASR